MKLKCWVGISLLCGLLAACSNFQMERMQPGSISIDQMRAREKPTAEWKNADGTLTLEYSTRAVSARNLMLDFDAKGMLREVRSVATLQNMALLKPAMTRAEVQRIIGSPDRVMKDRNSGGDIWEVPLESAESDVAQNLILVYWHPTVDGAVKILKGTRFE